VVDNRIIEEVRTGKVTYEEGKGIITNISQVGGGPEYKGDPIADSDHDGMPNWWETKYGLNPNDPSDAAKDLNGDGYTNIEKYLDGIDPKTVLNFKDPKNNVSTLSADKLFAPAAKPDAKDAAYEQAIEKRTQDIVALLTIVDASKLAKVHDTIIGQYRALENWQHSHGDAEQLKGLHADFLAKLGAELSPEQIEKVKDKMTYNKVQVTYDAYCEIVRGLTAEEKAQMLVFLKEAREEAMDGGSSKEKDTIFKKYKGKINNYLSDRGYDVAQAYKDWGARQKAATAKNTPANSPLN